MINKSGKELSIFEAKRLTAILNEPDKIQMGRAAQRNGRKVGDKLVLNRLGQPYTKDGLDSSFDRIKRQLVKEGKIRPGLTFHGLRKSLGKAAADAGFSENDIAGALGQANPASARVYTQEARPQSGSANTTTWSSSVSPNFIAKNGNRTRFWKNGAKDRGKTAFSALDFGANGRGLQRWTA
jgi:integrase